MQTKNKQIFWPSIIVLFFFFLASNVWAAFPAPQGFVNDFANVLDQRSRAEMQVISDQLKREQGIELAIVTLSSTAPLDPKEYTTALFNEWGIGGPEDSGLLMLLAVAEGAIEVEPGYGLEGVLPDGLIGAVIDQEGMPHFTNRNYSAGLVAMARAYASILAGEEFEIAEDKQDSGWISSFLIFMLIVILLRRNRRLPPGSTGGGGGGSRRTVFIPGPTRGGPGMPRGGGFGGFGGGRSGGGGAGRRF